MCRAIWVAVAGSSEEACRRLRRAAGPDAQVVAVSTHPAEVLGLAGPLDVAIVDGGMDGARDLVAGLRSSRPDTAVVWVGDDGGEQAHHMLAWNEGLDDSLPGAITKALIARGAAGRKT